MMNNVASYANIFNDFTRKLTMDMKPHIKKHFTEYIFVEGYYDELFLTRTFKNLWN